MQHDSFVMGCTRSDRKLCNPSQNSNGNGNGVQYTSVESVLEISQAAFKPAAVGFAADFSRLC